jgi:branched-chain amino acid transport system ATP-binding protein
MKPSPRIIPTWMRITAGPILAVIGIVLVSSQIVPAYLTYTIALACVYAVIVLSVSLLAGWAGIWSIGQPAMIAIGAYAAAYGSQHGWNLEFTIVAAVGISAACGAFLGYAGSRFSTLYIALLTLAFNLVILEIIEHWTEVTGGDEGVPVMTLTSFTGLYEIPAGGRAAEYFGIGALGVVCAGAVLARRSGARLRVSAVKSHILASRSIGVAPEAQQTMAFAASAGLAGFGGVLYALLGGFVSGETASLAFGIDLIAATVVGGTGLIFGAIIGGVFLAWSPMLASTLHVDQPILQGSILIIALILLRNGLAAPLASLLRRVFNIAHQDTMRSGDGERASLPLPPTREPGTPLVTVKELGVRFGGLRALERIDLTVGAGEIVCVIGPNGAGKTTFMNALSGLLPRRAVSGHIRYRGTALPSGHPTKRHRLAIARTFQHAELFSDLTVLQNVLVTKRRVRTSDLTLAWQILSELKLAEVANSFPGDLPFGTRKRVDLARALFTAPELLLMDEPFGGLDGDERSIMISTIKRVQSRGLTIIVIDHVLEDLRAVADRFVAFDFGTILAEGTPAEVLSDSKVRSAYLGESDELPEERTPRMKDSEDLILLKEVSYRYGGVHAVTDVDVQIKKGMITGIVGANGAGKSTTGKLLHGLIRPSSGTRTVTSETQADLRISLVPEGRALFGSLSVKENLEVAGYAAGLKRSEITEQLETWSKWLPARVTSRMSSPAGALSGGEQQMVAIARALMAKPDVIILDEPALGLAPALVDEVYKHINELSQSGLTVVLLEQLLARAIATCDSVYVLRNGKIHLAGNADEHDFEAKAEAAYFGGMEDAPTEVAI